VELKMVARSDAVLAPTGAKRSGGAWSSARRVANLIGTAISVVVVMVGCVGIVVAIATHFAPDGEYTVFGHPTLVVLSGSMSPAIRTGDLVIDNPMADGEASRLEAGQIISFRSAPGAKVITHRIARVKSAGGAVAYVTRGDANNAADMTTVDPSQIVGVYNTKIPNGGYILNALHQPLTLSLLLASPALWFLSGLCFQWAKEVDGGQRHEQSVTTADREGGER
jgi:signal peptidase